ncbi:MAG TPA: glycosyltransferase [Nitrososphaeraceae archaeon]|jgi:glycosyltransferase involved in cell wall biosynthesis|nr:glycosyltransferase [Nitrososphaeraceae archaeon]
MQVLILADERQKEGGNNEIIKHMISALYDHKIQVKYIKSEEYLPSYLPRKWRDLFRIFYLARISTADFSGFDISITLQPDSHCIRHRNHIIYFQHHIKQYYDLFWQSFKQKKGIRKKIVYLLLTLIYRLADSIYLTPNLKRSRIIVNSQTVGTRLKKYNRISNFSIIHPGCNMVEAISQAQSTTLSESHKKNERFFILAFSRLNVIQKGIDVIIKTAQFMPDYDFVIAGPYDTTIETIDGPTLPSNVQLIVKEFSEQEKAELFSNCDVFLAPYIQEDFGITPLEANAYGKPVVYCDDSGEIVEIQKHKDTGFMCRRIPQEIAKGIEYCIKNREYMKTACIDNASKYTWNKFECFFRTYINNLNIQEQSEGIMNRESMDAKKK